MVIYAIWMNSRKNESFLLKKDGQEVGFDVLRLMLLAQEKHFPYENQ